MFDLNVRLRSRRNWFQKFRNLQKNIKTFYTICISTMNADKNSLKAMFTARICKSTRLGSSMTVRKEKLDMKLFFGSQSRILIFLHKQTFRVLYRAFY